VALVIEKAGTLRAGGDVPAIRAVGYRRNVTLLRLRRWNVTLRRSVNPKDAWTSGAVSVPGSCLVRAFFVRWVVAAV